MFSSLRRCKNAPFGNPDRDQNARFPQQIDEVEGTGNIAHWLDCHGAFRRKHCARFRCSSVRGLLEFEASRAVIYPGISLYPLTGRFTAEGVSLQGHSPSFWQHLIHPSKSRGAQL